MTIRTVDLPADVTSTQLLHFVNKELQLTAARAGTITSEILQFVDTSAINPTTVHRIALLRRKESLATPLTCIGIALFVTCLILPVAGFPIMAMIILASMLACFICGTIVLGSMDLLSKSSENLLEENRNPIALQRTLQHAVRDADMQELRELVKHQEFVARYNLSQALNDRFALAEGNIPAAVPVVIAA